MPHVRESIMQNLKTTFESIRGIGSPIAAAANSGTPPDLIVQSTGTFTGTAEIIYTIKITTAGISGVAKCTVTGTDASGPHTITSGSQITIGSKGVKITFTFTGSLVLNDTWILTANIYTHSVRDVFRANSVGINLKEFPAIVFADTTQTYGAGEGDLYGNEMTVAIEEWVEQRDNMQTYLNECLFDTEWALMKDQLRGGFAFDTQLVSLETGLPEKDRPFGVIALEIKILFKQKIR